MTTPLVVEQHVPAEPARVWAAWTTADGMAAWWWPQLPDTTYSIDARTGRTYRISSTQAGIDVRGEYLVVDEPHEIQMTWVWLAEGEAEVEDHVLVQFTAADNDTTIVTVTHHLTQGPPAMDDYRRGWGDVLTRLATWLAVQQTAPTTSH